MKPGFEVPPSVGTVRARHFYSPPRPRAPRPRAGAPPPSNPALWCVASQTLTRALSCSAAQPTWQAVIEVGGGQQFVSEGRFYSCHSLVGVEAGQRIVFERVLATKSASEQLSLGHPYLEGVRVHAQVLEHFRAKKIMVFKMKAKKHYRRSKGHRQEMTRFLVTKVEGI